MKKLLPIILCLFTLQCEQGWLENIIDPSDPTIEGCNISSACNYNPDANKFDGSCEFMSCKDCLGYPFGVAVLDSCGTCDAAPGNDCIKDCAGTWGGIGEIDNCGNCTSENINCELDCMGVWGSSISIDVCGVCGGSTTSINDCTVCEIEGFILGCDGVCSDTPTVYDNCDICGGDDTICNDCGGKSNGTATTDNCGVCICGSNGTYGGVSSCLIQDGCNQDCNGTWGGSLVVDNCGICGGDHMSCTDCLGETGGTASMDNCGTCDNDSSNDCVQDCDGIWGGDNVKDCADVCGGSAALDQCGLCDTTTSNDCSQDCNGDWGGSAVGDCMGVCGGTAAPDCDGDCNGTHVLDCGGICRSTSSMEDLGDGYCDTSYPVLNCEEYNCDNGDCGTWDGSNCVGPEGLATIKYERIDIGDSSPYNISTQDPSINLATFEWDQYYSAIPGTYTFSYTGKQASDDEQFSGYYTTFINLGEIDDAEAHNECFQLKLYNYIGPTFSNYSHASDCDAFFNTSFSRSIATDYMHPDDELEYQRYLEAEAAEQRMIDIYGDAGSYNSNISPTITRIDNPTADILIMEIDSDPNVVVQQGKNYIMKYVKREISP